MKTKLLLILAQLIMSQSLFAQTDTEVSWSLKRTLSPVIAGAVLADDEAVNNLSIAYDGGVVFNEETLNDLQKLKPTDTDGSWPAEADINNERYMEFRLMAKQGITFTIDSVKCVLGAKGSNNIRTSIAYSLDEAFTNPSFLEEQIVLPQGGKGIDALHKEYAMNAVINENEYFYLRVYPFNTTGDNGSTSKYIYIQDVIISGSTVGEAPVELPSIVTDNVSYISVNSAFSGGSIDSDGGGIVSVRGVCWNTVTNPTIDNPKTEDGTGTGSYQSALTDLQPGTTYYLRAYATNIAGTSYGDEKVFTTLSQLEVPTVATVSASSILVSTAECGGNVANWGGDSVSVKGICWNSTGSPTTDDNITEDGNGIGPFNSLLTNLDANTTYYVRAYAINSVGIGYGNEITFTTQTPAPDILKIVAKDGSGDYTTVQAAFNDVPTFYTGKYTIYVKKGVYYEKLRLTDNKINVVLAGEDRDSTILTYDDYAGKAGGTSNCYSTAIDAADFTAIDITFQNTVVNDGSFADQQGVALRVDGDRQSFYNCKLLGYQDTYYTWGGGGTGRKYMKNCYIEGSVDFIFGRDIVVFDSCEIHINRNGGTLTAASTEPDSKFGYVFLDCVLSSAEIGFDGSPVTSFVLGRPWQQAPRTVFVRCEEPATLSAYGWSNWNVTPGLYAEYNCYGQGSDFAGRNPISRQLTAGESEEYTVENIFRKESNPGFAYDWFPVRPIVTELEDDFTDETLPREFNLHQNYPNPFNPSTSITFSMAKSERVQVKVYDILGNEVKILLDEQLNSGTYNLTFAGDELSSGVYFCRLSSASFSKTIKMILLK